MIESILIIFFSPSHSSHSSELNNFCLIVCEMRKKNFYNFSSLIRLDSELIRIFSDSRCLIFSKMKKRAKNALCGGKITNWCSSKGKKTTKFKKKISTFARYHQEWPIYSMMTRGMTCLNRLKEKRAKEEDQFRSTIVTGIAFMSQCHKRFRHTFKVKRLTSSHRRAKIETFRQCKTSSLHKIWNFKNLKTFWIYLILAREKN